MLYLFLLAGLPELILSALVSILVMSLINSVAMTVQTKREKTNKENLSSKGRVRVARQTIGFSLLLWFSLYFLLKHYLTT